VDELSREFRRVLPDQDDGELYRAACERNLMLAPINNAREIAPRPSSRREFFVEVEKPGRGRLRYPGAFRPEQREHNRHPPLGAAPRRAHAGGAGRARPRRGRAGAAPRRGGRVTDLLRGTTIFEFGGGAPARWTTRYFADHGAT